MGRTSHGIAELKKTARSQHLDPVRAAEACLSRDIGKKAAEASIVGTYRRERHLVQLMSCSIDDTVPHRYRIKIELVRGELLRTIRIINRLEGLLAGYDAEPVDPNGFVLNSIRVAAVIAERAYLRHLVGLAS